MHALALQTESSITYSHDKDGKAKHVTKGNNQNQDNNEQTMH
jgi:hypothetical protein